MLRKICGEKTDLQAEDICQLEAIACQLPLMAELTGADVFIDCFTTDGRAVVVAQSRPHTVGSAYEKNVVGAYVLPDKEPAVFHAMELQAPVRDLKAITQEERTVRQDAAPVLNGRGRSIAVLIREKDISGDLMQEKKFQSLAKTYEAGDVSLRSDRPAADELMLREMHHRVKNNLQMVASILSLQSRRCGDAFTRKILQENVGRVLSIAAIHDILTKNKDTLDGVDSLDLLDQLRKYLHAFVPEGKRITISVTGSPVKLSADAAASVALVVNELITNALEHAFEDRQDGNITVSFCPGQLFHTVTVTDDGCGFGEKPAHEGSLGLKLVEATVRDRLHGHLNIHWDESGSRVSFDFKIE